ncbi:LUD domain-containing protein [Parafrankia sp. EUN1f]|uniref:LUD domain-containing protein n=1 Tax=Parafrankia sp. EUN1f TaxID=102897 RepID=UPI0001C45F3E|nr:LUD domain-containing protein [Parafrankia sp. EUN1f]EFC81660.1 hypothetical protein FrEUN1fDRAFT_5197 [Parafrankia sp. EUN1f]
MSAALLAAQSLVVGSASGSQFAPYASGARRAIWVVGAQKIVPDLETALRRLRTYSLPREHQRLADLYGQSSFIGRILILEREAFPDRGTVILVRETIGFRSGTAGCGPAAAGRRATGRRPGAGVLASP